MALYQYFKKMDGNLEGTVGIAFHLLTMNAQNQRQYHVYAPCGYGIFNSAH